MNVKTLERKQIVGHKKSVRVSNECGEACLSLSKLIYINNKICGVY